MPAKIYTDKDASLEPLKNIYRDTLLRLLT